jgi:type II secretory pathway component PulF
VLYFFSASNSANSEIDGLIEAESQEEALTALKNRGLSPIQVREATENEIATKEVYITSRYVNPNQETDTEGSPSE